MGGPFRPGSTGKGVTTSRYLFHDINTVLRNKDTHHSNSSTKDKVGGSLVVDL